MSNQGDALLTHHRMHDADYREFREIPRCLGDPRGPVPLLRGPGWPRRVYLFKKQDYQGLDLEKLARQLSSS